MKKETIVVRFLYKTIIGRCVLKVLVRPRISQIVGKYLNSGYSIWLIPIFMKIFEVHMEEFEEKKYLSFNDFFTRKKRCRIDITTGHLISPCDGFLSIFKIDKEQKYYIKNVEYSLESLLQDSKIAERFTGGTCLIFRLTPKNNHRYCYVYDGVKKSEHTIPGVLHCVRPIAYTTIPVFIENSREYIEIDTGLYGSIIQMEIGALLIGKIHNHKSNETILQGSEKGYFEFGGSTIIVLIEKDRLEVSNKILDNIKKGIETSVKMGEMIGPLLL